MGLLCSRIVFLLLLSWEVRQMCLERFVKDRLRRQCLGIFGSMWSYNHLWWSREAHTAGYEPGKALGCSFKRKKKYWSQTLLTKLPVSTFVLTGHSRQAVNHVTEVGITLLKGWKEGHRETRTPMLILGCVAFNVSGIFMNIILFKIMYLRNLLVGHKDSWQNSCTGISLKLLLTEQATRQRMAEPADPCLPASWTRLQWFHRVKSMFDPIMPWQVQPLTLRIIRKAVCHVDLHPVFKAETLVLSWYCVLRH